MMPSPPSTVTVVIPCYNYGRFLPAVVASALDQPGVEVDVIIIDDASTDDSAAVAQSLASAIPLVSSLVNERNLGHIATYNCGLSAATGEFVVLLSADDLLAPGSLSRATSTLRLNENMSFVYGRTESFTKEVPQSRSLRSSTRHWSGNAWIGRVLKSGRNVILSPEVVMRRNAFESVGGFDPRFPHAADLRLWLELALHGSVGRLNCATQAYYRLHGDNMHLTTYSGALEDIFARHEVFDDFCAKHSRSFPFLIEARYRCRRTLAIEALRWGCHLHDAGAPDAVSSIDEAGTLARRICPEIRSSTAWDRYDSRVRGSAPRWRREFAELQWNFRGRLLWHRGRRVGL